MAELKTGVVQYVNEKNTRVGTTWNIRIEGDDRYFGCYKTKPNCEVGQVVEFQFSTNGQGFHNIDMKKGITVLETEVAESDGVQQSAAQTERAVAAKAKVDGKGERIAWQSARNTAAALLSVAAQADALPLGAKKDGKLEALTILFNQLTEELYNDGKVVQETGNSPFAEEV